MRRTTRNLLPIVALAALSGCGMDFDSRTLLKGYRVLGVVAEPPAVGPDGQMQVTVADVNTAGATYSYRVCLFDLGPFAEYRCVSDQLEFSLEGQGNQVTVDYGPDGLNLRALYEQYGPFLGEDGQERTFEDGFSVLLTIESGPPDGRRITTITDLRVRETNTPNANPGITAFTVDGQPSAAPAQPGAKVELAVTLADDALETYEDEFRGTITEEPVFTWYTTAGEVDPKVTFGDDRRTTLAVPKDQRGPVQVYVAVRDGRGGFATAGGTVTVP
jgi:hypothetical protein